MTGTNVTRQGLYVDTYPLELGFYSPAFVPNLDDDLVEKSLKCAINKINRTDDNEDMAPGPINPSSMFVAAMNAFRSFEKWAKEMIQSTLGRPLSLGMVP